jgi:hypothetical protein
MHAKSAEAQVLAPDGTVLAGYPRSLAYLPALYTLAPGSTGPSRESTGLTSGARLRIGVIRCDHAYR